VSPRAAGRRTIGRGRAAPSRRARREPGHAAGGPAVAGCAVLTVSDTRRGVADTGGALVARLVERAGHRVAARAWARDERAAIRRAAARAIGRADVDVLIVTGGTGIAPRDVTPEALAPLVERWLPGFGERFRALSHAQVGAAAWLSRAAAGTARGRLVVLLPGAPAALTLALRRLLLPELTHVLRLLGRAPGRKR
jgi:molybdopterin adenylyltransferase